MPSNFAPKDPNNPYADYSLANLFEFVSSYEDGRPTAAILHQNGRHQKATRVEP